MHSESERYAGSYIFSNSLDFPFTNNFCTFNGAVDHSLFVTSSTFIIIEKLTIVINMKKIIFYVVKFNIVKKEINNVVIKTVLSPTTKIISIIKIEQVKIKYYIFH